MVPWLLGWLKSRKFWLALVAGAVTFLVKLGILDTKAGDHLTNVLVVLIGAIAIEDHGAKMGLPPVAASDKPPEAKP